VDLRFEHGAQHGDTPGPRLPARVVQVKGCFLTLRRVACRAAVGALFRTLADRLLTLLTRRQVRPQGLSRSLEPVPRRRRPAYASARAGLRDLRHCERDSDEAGLMRTSSASGRASPPAGQSLDQATTPSRVDRTPHHDHITQRALGPVDLIEPSSEDSPTDARDAFLIRCVLEAPVSRHPRRRSHESHPRPHTCPALLRTACRHGSERRGACRAPR
jgi:hypothetical protein